MQPNLLFKDEVYQIVGAAMDIYNELGCGFHEPVYQETMEMELAERLVKSLPQVELPIFYKGKQLRKKYLCDLLCHGEIIVELKAIASLTNNEDAQLLNYLKASNLKLGVLINFGNPSGLQWKRLVR